MVHKEDGKVVAAFGMTHTPGLGNLMHLPPHDQVDRIVAGYDIVRKEIEEAKPDVIVAFVNDHVDMYTLYNMPAFSIAVGDTHWGPTPESEKWIQMSRAPIPGNPDVANALHRSLMEDGFELYRSGSAELVHNVLMPKKFLWPDIDIPVVPIFTNCFFEPLPTFRRAYELGKAVRKAIDRRPERVALMASGGLAHWPPIVLDDENDPLFPEVTEWHVLGRKIWDKNPGLPMAMAKRELEMAQSGFNYFNVPWDKEFLANLAKPDVDALLKTDHAEIQKAAGHGASEMLLWTSLVGAMNGAPADILMYEAVTAFSGSVSIMSYGNSIAGA